jgi:hypothetical protein
MREILRQIGAASVIFGGLAIVMNFFNYVPKVLGWIYGWGEGTAWGIKIAMIVVGGVLWFLCRRSANPPTV